MPIPKDIKQLASLIQSNSNNLPVTYAPYNAFIITSFSDSLLNMKCVTRSCP